MFLGGGTSWFLYTWSGIILCMGLANDSRRYNVMSFPID